MDRKLIICFGPICSGKTVWSLEYIKLNKDFLRFCFDEFLQMTTGEGKWNAKVGYSTPGAILALLARSGVVVDGMPLNMVSLKMLLTNAKRYDAKIEIRVFDVKIDEAIRRNRLRRKHTGIYVDFDEMVAYRKVFEDFINNPEFLELLEPPEIKTIYHNMDKVEYAL